MASMTFPAGIDSSILLHSANHQRPMIHTPVYRSRKCVVVGGIADCNSVGVSSTVDLFSSGCGGGRRRWKTHRVKAAAEENGPSDDDKDEALQATIEKSKKVIQMQKELLQQIAERRKLVSSIKNSIIDNEGNGQPFVENNATVSSPDSAAKTQENDTNPDQYVAADSTELGKDLTTNGTPFQSKEVSSVPWESVVGPSYGPSSTSASTEEDSLKKLNDTTVKTATLSYKPYKREVEQREDSNGSSPRNANVKAQVPKKEDVKPPPPAGPNVMNIIMVASECAPWSKTGGLGDVAGALPKALAKRGHRVMVVAPRYGDYAEAVNSGVRKYYKVDGQDMEVNYFQTYIDGVDFVFIESPIFRHIGENIYGGNRVDILKRMTLFCKAAVEVPWHVPCGGVCYGDGNLAFIANDWHTALLPVYLKAYYRDKGLMRYARSVLVIHNIAHQGRGPVDDFKYVDLPHNYLDLFKMYDPVGGDHFNIFAAGLKTADRVVTVSHGYSWELKTLEGGWGLHDIIKSNEWKLRGIVNGIDTKDWSPEIDVHLQSDGYVNYSLETLKTGKPKCKAALQNELGLPVRPDVPLIGFIGRLDNQKGVDLIAEAIPWMAENDVQLVMLGTGRADLEELLRRFEGQYRDKVRGWVGFSVRTAHRITGGADVLLMPSRFEPCGLNQLYAMRYGTVPVVHAVGGLRDTVQPFNPYEETGVGWTFGKAETSALIHALGNCLWTYREYKESWDGIQRRGMEKDLSWDNAAQNYEQVLVAAKYQW